MERLLYARILHQESTLPDTSASCSCTVDPRLLEESGLGQIQEIEIYNVSTNERVRTSARVANMNNPVVSINDEVAAKFNYGDLCIVSGTNPATNSRVPFAFARYYAKTNDRRFDVDKRRTRRCTRRAKQAV